MLPLKEKALRARLQICPDQRGTLAEFGSTLCETEKLEEGVDLLTRAREVDPDSGSLPMPWTIRSSSLLA